MMAQFDSFSMQLAVESMFPKNKTLAAVMRFMVVLDILTMREQVIPFNHSKDRLFSILWQHLTHCIDGLFLSCMHKNG